MLNLLSKLSPKYLVSFLRGQSSLKRMAIRGVFWIVSSYGLSMIMRIGSSLIMTRLLFPDLFGLMNLLYTLLAGLHLFSDMGSGPNIIRSEKGDDPELLNNVWTLQVIRGLVLWLICLLLALPASRFYNEPQLLWLLPIVGLSCIIGGLHSTSIFTLTRRMETGVWSRFQLQNQLISTSLTIGLALFNRNIWTLVVSYLLAESIQTIRSHYLIPNYRNRFAWNNSIIKELLNFGRWILMSTALTFLAGQSDRLLLGKFLSFTYLGIYSVAASLADMPRQLILSIASSVVFPALSQLSSHTRKEFHEKLLKNRWPILVLAATSIALTAAIGDLCVQVLYDHRYDQAGWMFFLLILGLWPNILISTVSPAMLALNKPYYETFGNSLKLMTTVIGIPLGYHALGLVGAVTAVAVNDILLYFSLVYGLWKEQLVCIGQDFKATVMFIALLIVMLSMRSFLGLPLPLNSLTISG
ncbi:MAG: hypothetical protein B0A82_25895 [Alkalinema sp. CACIAM 70d]|nr:MAG: hypothetical protein B0A82_25895 [Alkalinema sp. CACIAM 70d]